MYGDETYLTLIIGKKVDINRFNIGSIIKSGLGLKFKRDLKGEQHRGCETA
jgi:hypothetical protein